MIQFQLKKADLKKYTKKINAERMRPRHALCSRNFQNVKLRPTVWKFKNLIATQFYVLKKKKAILEIQILPKSISHKIWCQVNF